MTLPNVGELTLEIHSGRSRCGGTRLQFRCDAAAWRSNYVLLLSAVGSESSVKALAAALHSDRRIEMSARCDGDGENSKSVSCYRLLQHSAGYKVYRHKLLGAYGLWQILAVAKVDGFLPVLSEETVWQHLQGEKFTTPIHREWVPWIVAQLKAKELLTENDGFGATTGGLNVTDEQLDDLVRDGILSGALTIAGQTVGPRTSLFDFDRPGAMQAADLDDYMLRYGGLLAGQAEQALDPLHVPGRDALALPALLRRPFDAQAHVITAGVKALRRQKSLMVIGEMGVGKTLQGMVVAHQHAAGKPYRSLVFCPGQLTGKWAREITETIPGAIVRVIESWRDLIGLDRKAAPLGAEWHVIARDRAKLGACWQPATMRRQHMANDYVRCPGCGQILIDDKGVLLSAGAVEKRRTRCERVLSVERYVTRQVGDKTVSRPVLVPDDGCGEQLWQMNREINRYEPARYIKRRLRGYFDYLILDEQHQEKAAESAQANAAGALIAACRKAIGLTGTMVGGYAWHVKNLLFRMAPRSLASEGLTWKGDTAFNERYGRIETTIREKTKEGEVGPDNKMSSGSTSRSVNKNVRPGIMPALFARHLVDKAIFLSLAEVADNLPELREECVPVAMDAETAREYRDIEDKLRERLTEMVRKGDRRLLGKFLQTLLAYPDYPFGWGEIGYTDENGNLVCVCEPTNLDPDTVRPKEQALIDLVLAEKAAGRQAWVFVQFTSAHDVQGRLAGLLKAAGLKVGVLKSSVSMDKREEWIAKNGPKRDVALCHPKLVETGLDLFDKGGGHNFPTLIFYESGYDLFAMRQASRRSWRIGQTLPCKTIYLYYAGTMQERAPALMAKKLAASQALEGKFSSDGLVAMGGEEGSVEMALAKSLADRLDEGDARRAWARVTGGPAAHGGPAPSCAPPPCDLSGNDVVSLMKRQKVTIPQLAERLGVSQYRVRAARRAGVLGADVGRWRAAAERGGGKAGDKAPRKRAGGSTGRGRAGSKRGGKGQHRVTSPC